MDDSPKLPPHISRRGFLGRAALAAGAGLAAGGIPTAASAQQPRSGLPQIHTPSRTPLARVPRGLAQHIIHGDCSLCVVGDSTCTDGSSASNIPYGIQRTWKPDRWVGRTGRIVQGPPPWALSHMYNTYYYSEATQGSVHYRVPGSYFGGGDIAISPNTAYDWLFGNLDLPDNDPLLGEITPNDLANYATGNWTDSTPVRARFIYWRGSQFMVEALRIRGKRGPGFVGSTTVPMQGTAGVVYADVECGAGAGIPGMYITSQPGVDERGTRAYPLGAGFWRHDGAGGRVPGFTLTQIGEGGWNTSDHLATWRCSNLALAGFMAASFQPNTFLLHILNQTGPEINHLNAGSTALYKDNIRAVMSRYATAAAAAGVQGPIRWLLVSPYPVGFGPLNTATRAKALYEVCMEDPDHRGFIDLHRLAADRIGNNFTWYTADGVHPNAAGASYLAALIWSHVAAAAQ